jgi:hypothetical protein
MGVKTTGGANVLLEFRLVFAEVMPESGQVAPFKRRKTGGALCSTARYFTQVFREFMGFPTACFIWFDMRKKLHPDSFHDAGLCRNCIPANQTGCPVPGED